MSKIEVDPKLVQAVIDYAKANYTRGGWDVIVETYERAELAEIIGNATTEKQAISRVRKVAKMQRDRYLDAQYE